MSSPLPLPAATSARTLRNSTPTNSQVGADTQVSSGQVSIGQVSIAPGSGARKHTHTVHHGGNTYFATAAMAEIFRAHACRTASRGDTELVPLLHSSGVDLLLITPTTTFAVVPIEVGSHAAVRSH